ncbi:DoxX family protein [Gordonia sihwensis]|uniref:DoxX family protein n=1 Tax=Gordonia TaxID=2053 RepID=UPI002416918C|nr:DoxX family protein [Gordonia sihwensis]WFN92436.1 DoxX family protein [Gordonia sihwensis]
MNLIHAAGRALTGIPYMILGYDAATAPGARVEAASPLLDKIRTVIPLPTDNETIVRANGAAQVLGGAMIATGLGARPGAVLLAASLVPTTFAGHAFWEIDDPMQHKMQQIQFLKNVSMLGGALAVLVASRHRS